MNGSPFMATNNIGEQVNAKVFPIKVEKEKVEIIN